MTRTKINCVNCAAKFTVEAPDEPLFCCFCQSEIVLDFSEDTNPFDDDEDDSEDDFMRE